MMCPESGCGGLVSILLADAIVDLCLLPGADILEKSASCSVFSADKLPEYVGLFVPFLATGRGRRAGWLGKLRVVIRGWDERGCAPTVATSTPYPIALTLPRTRYHTPGDHTAYPPALSRTQDHTQCMPPVISHTRTRTRTLRVNTHCHGWRTQLARDHLVSRDALACTCICVGVSLVGCGRLRAANRSDCAGCGARRLQPRHRHLAGPAEKDGKGAEDERRSGSQG